MTYKFFLILLTACLFFHCETMTSDPITEEVMSLNSDMEKKNFLEKIYRDSEGENLIKLENIEEINLQKVEAYLGLFGYPKKSAVGPTATKAPWLVINNLRSKNELDIKREFFPMFFKAYLNADISDLHMSMYLNRFYKKQFGKKHKSAAIKGSKEEINLLIGLLNLETSLN